jgi:hypothetical protein
MPTSITPKSEFRTNHNIRVGFAEIPAIIVNDDVLWGLPGGSVTRSRKEATAYAHKLANYLSRTVKDVSQLSRANPQIIKKYS